MEKIKAKKRSVDDQTLDDAHKTSEAMRRSGKSYKHSMMSKLTEVKHLIGKHTHSIESSISENAKKTIAFVQSMQKKLSVVHATAPLTNFDSKSTTDRNENDKSETNEKSAKSDKSEKNDKNDRVEKAKNELNNVFSSLLQILNQLKAIRGGGGDNVEFEVAEPVNKTTDDSDSKEFDKIAIFYNEKSTEKATETPKVSDECLVAGFPRQMNNEYLIDFSDRWR